MKMTTKSLMALSVVATVYLAFGHEGWPPGNTHLHGAYCYHEIGYPDSCESDRDPCETDPDGCQAHVDGPLNEDFCTTHEADPNDECVYYDTILSEDETGGTCEKDQGFSGYFKPCKCKNTDPTRTQVTTTQVCST